MQDVRTHMPVVSASKRSLLWGSLVGACMLPLAAHAAVTGAITQLSTAVASSTQTAPAVSGTSIVWSGVSTLDSGTDYDVVYSDLSTTVAPRDLNNTTADLELSPDIDSSYVTWVHNGFGSPGDIIVYDSGSNSQSTIAASSANLRFDQPAVRGRYVVYVRSSSQFDIDGYDLLLGLPLTQLTNDVAPQLHPRLSGDMVVYEDYNSGNADIASYKISTQGPPTYVATGAAAQTAPDIDGNYVVWVETTSDGVDQINSYNLSTLAYQMITTVPSHKHAPRVSGTRVVWSDDRGGNLDLYTFDFATNTEDLLVGGVGDQTAADIDGTRVVYTSNDTGFEQVYLYTFTSGPPPSLYPEGCDPAKTDPADGAVVLAKDTKNPYFTTRAYTVVDGKNYWLCVENGSNGGAKTYNLTITNDGKAVISPLDFKPVTNPPKWVAGKLFPDDGGNHGGPTVKHSWTASLLGAALANVTVTLRVGK